MHAPLQVPALAVLHGCRAELKVDKLAHFSQLTPGRAADSPGSAQGRRLPARPARSSLAAGGGTMRR
jgi:hypothetical protein